MASQKAFGGQIVIQKKELVALGQKVFIGGLAGAQQVGLEKADEARQVSDISITALQNIVPLIEVVGASAAVVLSKSNAVKVIASDFVNAESAMLAYRMIKVAVPRISGFMKKHGKKVSDFNLGHGSGGQKQTQSSPSFNYNYSP